MARRNGKKGGRPKGTSNALAKITEHKARELAAKGATPLDVMIANMNFWRERAAELTDVMQKKLEELCALKISTPEEQRYFIEAMRDFNKIAAHMIAAREKAQSCAVDAAPYVHPKLSSIAVKPQRSANIKIQMAIAVAVTQVLDDDGSISARITNGRAA